MILTTTKGTVSVVDFSRPAKKAISVFHTVGLVSETAKVGDTAVFLLSPDGIFANYVTEKIYGFLD